LERHWNAQIAVGQVLAKGATLPQVTAGILETLCESLGWDVGEVWEVDERVDMLRRIDIVMFSAEGKVVEPEQEPIALSRGEGLAGAVWAEGEPIWAPNVLKNGRFNRHAQARKLGLSTACCVPMVHDQVVVGVLELFCRDVLPQDDAVLRTILTIGSQLGQVMLRKRTEIALRASEQRFREIAENISEVFWMTVPGFCETLYVSPAYDTIWGRSRHELLETPLAWMDAIHPDDRAMVERVLAEHPDGDDQVEFRVIRPDGSLRWIRGRGFPIRDESGTPFRVVGNACDITDRKLAEETLRASEERLKCHFERLSALRAIDSAILGIMDLRLTLNLIVEQAVAGLTSHAARVLMLNPDAHLLKSAAARGFRSHRSMHVEIRLGDGFAGQVALRREPLAIENLAEVDCTDNNPELIEAEGFVEYHAVPLISKGIVKGVLEVFSRVARERDLEWHDFLETLAARAAISIDNSTMFNDLQRTNAELVVAYDRTLEGWVKALDLRDKETEGHTLRVADMTLRVARAIGMDDTELAHVRRGALLHDIGKLGTPDTVLLKAGPLNDEELIIMRRHPELAYEWLWPITFLRPALAIPYCHHEKWDGTGYPRGLMGEQIPLAARVFAIIDVWDALLSDRPYRKGWPPAKVLAHIESLSGTHFDPTIAHIFLEMVRHENTLADAA
jgi:PAS domain S-box-containing protein/putative nucleotidyltransferase with HDIG domain